MDDESCFCFFIMDCHGLPLGAHMLMSYAQAQVVARAQRPKPSH